MAQQVSGKKRRIAITDTVEARVEMLNGSFLLPDETKSAMNAIRAAAAEYGRAVRRIIKSTNYDEGRFIATIDAIQLSKNIACDAIILAHASKEVDEPEEPKTPEMSTA